MWEKSADRLSASQSGSESATARNANAERGVLLRKPGRIVRIASELDRAQPRMPIRRRQRSQSRRLPIVFDNCRCAVCVRLHALIKNTGDEASKEVGVKIRKDVRRRPPNVSIGRPDTVNVQNLASHGVPKPRPGSVADKKKKMTKAYKGLPKIVFNKISVLDGRDI